MRPTRLSVALIAFSLYSAGNIAPSRASAESPAQNASIAAREPQLETPTLHSLGMHWVIGGDENSNAEVKVAWRTRGGRWRDAAPLFRVEKGAHEPQKGSGSVDVPADSSLFAGSLLMLAPGTVYDVKLALADPDGGDREAMLSARTPSEPLEPANLVTWYVIPGRGGGTGTADDPFRGIEAAQSKARAGTLFLLKAGKYPAPFELTRSGEPGQPIIWRGEGDGKTVIDGGNQPDARIVSADALHDLFLEGVTIENGGKAIVAHGASRIVVRRCHIRGVEYGIIATRNDGDTTREWFISDNVIEGPSQWPRTKGIENARGIQITGEGHVICYNRIRAFADAIDTFPSRRCASIDIHNNEISEMTDDGVELDFSERNVRCFQNRLTDVFQGISTQPVFGGPAYIFRNAMYNVVEEPFKLHNSPSGCLIIHNTVVKKGTPFFVHTKEAVRNSRTRNNLFIGNGGKYAFDLEPKMRGCDFDFDGVGGGPWAPFLKWNGVRYTSPEEVRQKAPVWRHCISIDVTTAFASAAHSPQDEKEVHSPMDLRLNSETAAIDAGELLAGINDDHAGKAPDLGAYEFGMPLPQYGPRHLSPLK